MRNTFVILMIEFLDSYPDRTADFSVRLCQSSNTDIVAPSAARLLVSYHLNAGIVTRILPGPLQSIPPSSYISQIPDSNTQTHRQYLFLPVRGLLFSQLTPGLFLLINYTDMGTSRGDMLVAHGFLLHQPEVI